MRSSRGWQPRRTTLAERAGAIARLGLFSGGALRHVAQKLGLMTLGAAYVSDPARRLRLYLDKPVSALPLRVAVVAHVYYPDLIEEIFAMPQLYASRHSSLFDSSARAYGNGPRRYSQCD